MSRTLSIQVAVSTFVFCMLAIFCGKAASPGERVSSLSDAELAQLTGSQSPAWCRHYSDCDFEDSGPCWDWGVADCANKDAGESCKNEFGFTITRRLYYSPEECNTVMGNQYCNSPSATNVLCSRSYACLCVLNGVGNMVCGTQTVTGVFCEILSTSNLCQYQACPL